MPVASLQIPANVTTLRAEMTGDRPQKSAAVYSIHLSATAKCQRGKPMAVHYQSAQFLTSATTPSTLPPEQGLEVAFAGRSNSGKSSTLNRLCQQKALARTSKTPGRTQLINFFELPDGNRLVDLPGYGYAKVPEATKLQWQRFIEGYFQQRSTLAGLIIVMDIRHPMRDYDYMMLEWATAAELQTHILLNKSDKLKSGKTKQALDAVRRELRDQSFNTSVQTFSSLKNTGTEALRECLDKWLGENTTDIKKP